MDGIRFVPLAEIPAQEIIELMNNERVGKLLPLLRSAFTAELCESFLQAKQELWDTHGYGPWAFLIDGEFAGWGGLQAEQGEADFALILHPRYWGWGRKIFNKIKEDAFGRMNLDSITVLFPPSRPNSRAITRIGFVAEESVDIDGAVFQRFRLHKPEPQCAGV